MTQRPVEARGRAARSNDSSRFDDLKREAFDDGWDLDDNAPHQMATTLTPERARSIISYNKSPDLPFDRTINPYRGCEHGCIYCYARPNHAYVGLSPGLDFETKLLFKRDAAVLLERELSHPKYLPRHVQLGGSTDPYQPIERELQISRQLLEVLERFNHPVAITTKGVLVLRDADILARMAEKQLAFVTIAVTTLDRKLARAMEPRASTPERRLAAIEALTRAGIPVSVGLSPMIPGLTDHEMDAILARAAAVGARTAHYIPLRMPLEIKDLFREWLEAQAPDRAKKVIAFVRQMHGGRDYDAEFGKRMKGEGPLAEVMRTRFLIACRRLGLDQKDLPLRTDLFAPPARPGDQLGLFG